MNGGIYLIRACGLRILCSQIPGVGLGGLMLQSERNAFAGLPFTSPDFYDFPIVELEKYSAQYTQEIKHLGC